MSGNIRIGYGYDAHRLKKGRKCILCGVDIPAEAGPDGHSDADAPLHALMDAMLGALALGDIGNYFPDSDERFRGADSIELLNTVYDDIQARGYEWVNADITIVLESPRIAPYSDKMRANIAVALETDIGNISVKATTEEKMGFTGDGTGISSISAVLIKEKE
jgi:2-C-methyl-D-erythritol 2,4-cyclodiphosphate synthase